MVTELIGRIENALSDNDGAALERAWHELYALDKAKAVHVAYLMRPLARAT